MDGHLNITDEGGTVQIRISKAFLILFGFLATRQQISLTPPPPLMDRRVMRLHQFFEQLNAPAAALVPDFIQAADRHRLDWRLLPSLAVIESGGGRQATNNNYFGWENGRRRFRSPRHGVYHVAERLRHSRLYRNKKTVEEILWTYNPEQQYVERVLRLMRRLDETRGQARFN